MIAVGNLNTKTVVLEPQKLKFGGDFLQNKLLRGILIPLPTVFLLNGEVDVDVMKELVDFYVDSGVQGLFVCGSYGMGPAMRMDQRKQVADLVAKQLNGRIPFIVHCGTVDVYSAVELTDHAKSIGALASALLPPFYYSDHTEYEIIEHFRFVSESVDIPIMIYDNPKYTGIEMNVDRVLRIIDKVPAVRAIKLNIMTAERALGYLRMLPQDFAVFPSVISSLIAGKPKGFDGLMNPPTSHLPELQVNYWNAIDNEDWTEAALCHWQLSEIDGVITEFWKSNGRAPFKEAMKLRGIPVKMFPRWPIKDLTQQQIGMIFKHHEEVGLGKFIADRSMKTFEK